MRFILTIAVLLVAGPVAAVEPGFCIHGDMQRVLRVQEGILADLNRKIAAHEIERWRAALLLELQGYALIDLSRQLECPPGQR